MFYGSCTGHLENRCAKQPVSIGQHCYSYSYYYCYSYYYYYYCYYY
jgi:hypothetical protein